MDKSQNVLVQIRNIFVIVTKYICLNHRFEGSLGGVNKQLARQGASNSYQVAMRSRRERTILVDSALIQFVFTTCPRARSINHLVL